MNTSKKKKKNRNEDCLRKAENFNIHALGTGCAPVLQNTHNGRFIQAVPGGVTQYMGNATRVLCLFPFLFIISLLSVVLHFLMTIGTFEIGAG